ncbi:hypothetical protein COCON_G00226900 [Conger conger]|uniref:Uncharacterized protein n=1 Tax=Conger conger TaxID=82655 RepID=A0A9Q1CXF6_CONCO|nr:hypothetical protein COCON_G00226900 [Conger conger]
MPFSLRSLERNARRGTEHGTDFISEALQLFPVPAGPDVSVSSVGAQPAALTHGRAEISGMWRLNGIGLLSGSTGQQPEGRVTSGQP